jgi:dihydropteroate synthase
MICRDHAVAQAEQMMKDGADIIDVGGHSTRPGAAPVSPQEEIDRIAPVIRHYSYSNRPHVLSIPA